MERTGTPSKHGSEATHGAAHIPEATAAKWREELGGTCFREPPGAGIPLAMVRGLFPRHTAHCNRESE